MRLFECQSCGKPHHFESVGCESCGAQLGFVPQEGGMSAFAQSGTELTSHRRRASYRYCAWEDFAETWAHYLHMADTLETVGAFGVQTQPEAANRALGASIDFNPYEASVDRLVFAWQPLTLTFNAVNRSMGQGDLYPFAFGAPTMLKLTFIYDLIHRRRLNDQERDSAALKAVAAHLKRGISSR